MDLYDEYEHCISSDEYSDDVDDDEDLMNDAIRAQDKSYERSKLFNHQNNQTKFEINRKQKELSSLIRKNKISVIYKNKSIRWLNSKKQREKYKELIYHNKDKKSVLLDKNVKEDAKEHKEVEMEQSLLLSVISIADTDNESIISIQNNQSKLSDISAKTDVDKKCNAVDAKENPEKLNEDYEFEKQNWIPKKRVRSSTPIIGYESSELKLKQNANKNCINSPQFYKNINAMFPEFDSIATDHINTITKNTLTSVEENMKALVSEINTLSEILNTKEMEWNRLLHLKTVKEEIYSRLRQKRQNLIIENYSKTETNRNLEDLKELEFYLSAKKPVSPGVSSSTIAIQKLIEKRANMNAEELEREKSNTSRLHSLLVSSNILHGKESSGSISSIDNGKITNLLTTCKNNELFKEIKEEAFVSKKCLQGDVKGIIADFRQKKSEILPLAGNQINLSNSVSNQHSSSIPVHDTKFSSPQYLSIHRQSDPFPHKNSVEEISILPIGRFKKLSSEPDNNFICTVNNNLNNVSEDNYLKDRNRTYVDGKLTKNIHYPLCQECKTNESRFVCAGCGNQWYCSKKCQVSAWDKHSDLCTE